MAGSVPVQSPGNARRGPASKHGQPASKPVSGCGDNAGLTLHPTPGEPAHEQKIVAPPGRRTAGRTCRRARHRPTRTSRCAWSCPSRPVAPPTSSPASSPRRPTLRWARPWWSRTRPAAAARSVRWKSSAPRRRLRAGHGHGVDDRGQPGDQPEDPLRPDDRLHAHHQHRGHAQRDRGAPQLPGPRLQGLPRRAEEEPGQVQLRQLGHRRHRPPADRAVQEPVGRPSSRTSRTAAPARR